MKPKVLLLFLILFSLNLNYSQSNEEIAYVYLSRAEESYNENDLQGSLKTFEKVLKYGDSIKDSRIARLGMLLHYDNKEFFLARAFSRDYFEYVKDKSSEEYTEMLDLHVTIQEEIDKFVAEQRRLEKEQAQKEKEKKRRDSLTKIWTGLAKNFELKIDTVYKFNKNKLAVFKKNNRLGIIDDLGSIIEKPTIYNDFITYDGYILLLDNINAPTKIFAFDTATKSGFLLPSVKAFNNTSTTYGKIMLPRANGLLITYPNNADITIVYNLKTKEINQLGDLKTILKQLKKDDIIEKYSKEEQLRINKQWYNFGGLVGKGVYSLYSENKLYGFLSTIDGTFFNQEAYNYLGPFYDGTFEVSEGNKRYWMDAQGNRQVNNKDENGKYKGISRFIKQPNGNYIILQNQNGKDYLVLGNQSLINKDLFVSKK